MPDAFISPDPILLILFILFSLCFLIQMIFYWVFFIRIIFSGKNTVRQNQSPAVSVVICAHNELHNLQNTLPQILSQDYPQFEVIVVNHASDDDSDVFLSQMALANNHLKIVEIKEDLNFYRGKKFPLSIGIRSAKHEIVLLTDADCRPDSNQWISLMVSPFSEKTGIVLGYGAYERKRGFLNRMIRYDTVHIALQYLSFALSGIPYMGVGRNLSYRKDLFIRQKGFSSHYRIQGGDDDLFINQVATGKNTAVMILKAAFTFSLPKRKPVHWFRQKRRHLTTALHYKFKHKLFLGSYSTSQLFFWIFFGILIFFRFAWLFVLGLLFLKWVSQYIVIGSGMSRLKEKDLVWQIPLLEFTMIIINTGIAISNLLNKPRQWN